MIKGEMSMTWRKWMRLRNHSDGFQLEIAFSKLCLSGSIL
jgi:hypothetical protein